MVSSAASLPCDLLQAPYTSLLEALEKKKEYLLKRVEKLNKLNDDAKNGTVLTEVQDEARKKLPEVEAQVDYLKRLGKQIKENQRDFNKQRRQRDVAQSTKVTEDHHSTVVDTLVIRHVLEEYRRNVGGKGYCDSFTAEERTRIDYLESIFIPKIDKRSELRQVLQKNAPIIAAIQRQDANVIVTEGFTAVDAHHLLTILIGLVEQADLSVSDIEVEDTEVEALTHLPASIIAKKANVDIQVLPEEVIEPDTVRFGYSSEDDIAAKESKESPLTTTANAASSPEQDLRSLESGSLPPCGSPDNTSCTENSEQCTTPDESLPPSASMEVSSAEEELPKDPVNKEQVNDAAPVPVKEDKVDPVEKEGANRARHGRRRGNNQRNDNGAPRDAQKRFNKGNRNRSPGQNENAHTHSRDGATKNAKSNGYRGGRNGQHNGRSTGHFNDRSNGNFSDRSAGNFNGRSNGNSYANNSYNNGGGYTKNFDRHGYVRHGGYVRPPPGTCGFILQVDN